MDRETWLLWLLADSQLPTGGFVASAGLEAALQGGLIKENAYLQASDSFVTFIRDSTSNQARVSLPFCATIHEQVNGILSDPGVGVSNTDTIASAISILIKMDDYHQAMLSSNRVAMRASTAQGGGLLSLFIRGYSLSTCMSTPKGQLCKQISKEFQRLSRLGKVKGHWPTVFSFICAALDISIDRMQQLFLFQFLRQVYSAAIRLNLVGPLQAQTLECDMFTFVADLLERYSKTRVQMDTIEHVFGQEVVYIDPILELYQGMHDRLYSRIFNS